MQPYHAAEELDLPLAEKLIRRLQESSGRLALRAVKGAISEVAKSGHDVVACGILLASGRPLGTLSDTLASHAKIHTADGEHFREAIARAAQECGFGMTKARERDVWETAAGKMKVPLETFQTRIAAIGKTLGPPWRADEKLAAAVGCLALAAGSRRR
jgi:hypothetical protein